MMSDLNQKIADWLTPRLENTDVYIVDVLYLPKRDKIQVFLDADSHIGIETCVEISRYLEDLLEKSGAVSQHYTLEVSSPGIGTPFKKFRQYLKAIGKQIEITLQNDTLQEGVLVTASETELTIQPLPEKSNKKVKTVLPPLLISFEQIKFTKEKIVF